MFRKFDNSENSFPKNESGKIKIVEIPIIIIFPWKAIEKLVEKGLNLGLVFVMLLLNLTNEKFDLYQELRFNHM